MEQLQDPSGATWESLYYSPAGHHGDTDTHLHGGHQAVHVVPSVTVITEEQLIIILTGAAQCTGLALDALPGVLLHADHHVVGELQASWVT